MTPQPIAHQSDRLPRGTLDRETVVVAALEIADREGLNGVTMARVAAALGARAMSLYRHVRDKRELVEAIAELALGEIPAIAQDRRSWRVRLEEHALAARQVVLRHPVLVEVGFDQSVLYGPAATAIGLDAMALLREAGHDEDSAIRCYMSFRNYTLGALAWEVSRFRDGGDEFRRRELESFVRRGTAADSPLWHFGEVVADDPEAQFMFGVSSILDGFETNLRRSRKRSR